MALEKSQNLFLSTNEFKTDYPCNLKLWLIYFFLHNLYKNEKKVCYNVECHDLRSKSIQMWFLNNNFTKTNIMTS